MDVLDTADLGRLILRARTRREWSQQQAAEAAGISRRLVNQLEGGEHPNAELWRVLALLAALNVRLQADVSPADVAATAAFALQVAVTATGEVHPGPGSDDFDLDAHVASFAARQDGA